MFFLCFPFRSFCSQIPGPDLKQERNEGRKEANKQTSKQDPKEENNSFEGQQIEDERNKDGKTRDNKFQPPRDTTMQGEFSFM